ncbi:Protein of unknown function DUF688 [Dillenia turbinata]|uniref:Uncharacterized protein n=1 Tax=Dillenia turbinata TaxID=194707 RepID=A0AAN8ZAA7_9MAGN
MSARRYPSPLADRRNQQVVEKSVPNRQQSLPSYKLGQVTEPVAVPFLWEQIPGMPKSKNRQESRVSYDPSVTPRLPPKLKENRSKSGPIVLISNADQKRESFNKATVQNTGPDMENDDDDDDAYSDALDAFSELESLSLSCSVSGLSGSDGLDAKPCGTFFIDPQTRDLMMNRFLPAAKAMILETPLYVSKKQAATPERPRRSVDESAKGRRVQLNQYGSNTIPQYDQDAGGEESEDEDYDDNDSVNLRVKGCGLIPRFCVKNSALLNTVPGVKVRTPVPVSSAKGNGRIPKTHRSGPLSQTVYTEMDGVLKSPKLLRDDSRLIGKHHSSKFTDSQTSDVLSPHKQALHGRLPYKEVPKSLFREGVGFLGMPKETVNCNLNSSGGNEEIYRNKVTSGSASLAVEKTLYIDSVHSTAVPHSDSNFSDSKWLTGIAGNDLKSPPAASSLQIVQVDVWKEEGILKPPSLDVLNKKGLENSTKGFKLDQGLDDKRKSFRGSEVPTREKKSEPVPKSDNKGNFSENSLQSPLAPPLPKSPSESWLWRSLPSISSKKSFSSLAAKFMSKKQADKTSSTETTWETIVKSSKVHYDHVRFSEVTLNLSHILLSNPERPKVLEKPTHELKCGKWVQRQMASPPFSLISILVKAPSFQVTLCILVRCLPLTATFWLFTFLEMEIL